MSEENEADDYEFLNNLSVNIELDSFEALSTVSSAPSQICEFGGSIIFSPQNSHIIRQLASREIGIPLKNSSALRLLPLRSYILEKILSASCLQNHVFMGMTRCGRFLMTYSTQLHSEEDEWYGWVHRYMLHWWIFPPDGKAKEIASVILFGNCKVTAPLLVFICQWPKFNDKVLVYGLMKESREVGSVNQRAFVTVTAIPSVYCLDCISIQQSSTLFLDDGIKSRCFKHSFAVHTSFDINIPYPEFHPKNFLKCEDYAVFNTNNALHALRISIDHTTSGSCDDVDRDQSVLSVQVASSPTPCFSSQSLLQEQIIRDFADESSLTPRQNEESLLSPAKPDLGFPSLVDSLGCMSPPLPTRLKTFPESQRVRPAPSILNHEFLAPKGVFKVKKLGARRLQLRHKELFAVFRESHSSHSSNSRKSSPYEFVDDSQIEVEQLSQFRRKRLAEKTYEFQENEAENILPFSLAREGPSRNFSRFHVLRPVNRNTLEQLRLIQSRSKFGSGGDDKSCRWENSELQRPRLSDDDVLVGDLSSRYQPISAEEEERLHAGLCRLRHCFRGSATRFTRRYIDGGPLPTKVTSDIDDDETTVGGYHLLLNMEVLGCHNRPMQVLRPCVSKDEPCIRVEQQCLDIETICQSVATSLCVVAHKTFTFCNDYDVEVVDVCPRSGDVLALLMMRIEGCEGKKEECSKIEQFEVSVTLLWNLIQGDYRIILVVPPQKMKWAWNEEAMWNPAREASRAIRLHLPADVTWTDPTVRLCSNSSIFRGISLDRILDYDNGVQFLR